MKRDEADASRSHNTDGTQHQRREISAEEARQGEIILRTPQRRWIFLSGLIGIVVLALLGALLF